MRLTNYTNVPDELLRAMVRFAVPSGVTMFDITFKNSGDGSLHGLAYTKGTTYHMRGGKCPKLITISVPKWYGDNPRPLRNKYRFASHDGNPRRKLGIQRQQCRGYMPDECFSEHEKLVHIIAHELRHLWQAKVKGRRVWGGRGTYSERDADAYGIHITREWRRSSEPTTINQPSHESATEPTSLYRPISVPRTVKNSKSRLCAV